MKVWAPIVSATNPVTIAIIQLLPTRIENIPAMLQICIVPIIIAPIISPILLLAFIEIVTIAVRGNTIPTEITPAIIGSSKYTLSIRF